MPDRVLSNRPGRRPSQQPLREPFPGNQANILCKHLALPRDPCYYCSVEAGYMADRARNQYGLGKSVTFNVITPMTRFGTCAVRLLLMYFDRTKSTQKTAKQLSFLPFLHWVVVRRNAFPCLASNQPKEQLNYDYLFFLSTFNGPWSPYIDAFADVLFEALDAVWFWSIGYPFARPVSGLKTYIVRNQVESDHAYSAYPGASVRDVRSALELHDELVRFERETRGLTAAQFEAEFGRLLIRI